MRPATSPVNYSYADFMRYGEVFGRRPGGLSHSNLKFTGHLFVANMKWLLLRLLDFYKVAVSPWLPPACRFTPTCSAYTREAIEKHGAARGFWLGLRRLLRCQPFCAGGYDPVP